MSAVSQHVPDRACCCAAPPMVGVIMPATRALPVPVDLWLCGHHWRLSRRKLRAIGARVHRLAAAAPGTWERAASCGPTAA